MPDLQLTPREWIAIGAAIVATIAALISFRSSHIAAKAYALAARQEERRQPSLSLSLLQSDLRRLGKEGPRIYVFRIMISNTSDSPSAVREARLELEYSVSGNSLSSLVVSHDDRIGGRLTAIPGDALRLPCSLQPRSSIAGVVLFEIPSGLLRKSHVESCTILIEDPLGHTARLEALFLQERDP